MAGRGDRRLRGRDIRASAVVARGRRYVAAGFGDGRRDAVAAALARGSGRSGTFTLGLAHRFDIGPELRKRRGDFLLAGGEMLVEGFLALSEAVVEVEGLNLKGEAALDVF